MIKYAVRHHFPDLPDSNNSVEYANSYLEKLIQVPFRIPALGITETQTYITLLLLETKITDKDKFKKILELGKSTLCKPWEGRSIDSAEIIKVTGEDREIREIILLAEQITPTLSSGTRGNPRQIKRFLNALNIRFHIAKSRGFDSEIKPAFLAKLMLAELYLKSVFDVITKEAVNSPNGICKELQYFESSLDESNIKLEGESNENINIKELTDSPNILSWKTSAEILQWSKTKPIFATENLKPYLFIIQDRKNYFTSELGLDPKLISLLYKLNAGELSAAGCVQELQSLVPEEVDILFQQLRSALLTSPNFDNKPASIYGIIQLVKAHPNFQIRYVALLKEIPITKIGAWVVNGHDFINNPIAKQDMNTYLKELQQHGSKAVKAMAKVQINTPERTI